MRVVKYLEILWLSLICYSEMPQKLSNEISFICAEVVVTLNQESNFTNESNSSHITLQSFSQKLEIE